MMKVPQMKSFGTSDIRAWLPQGDVAPPWPEVLVPEQEGGGGGGIQAMQWGEMIIGTSLS